MEKKSNICKGLIFMSVCNKVQDPTLKTRTLDVFPYIKLDPSVRSVLLLSLKPLILTDCLCSKQSVRVGNT